MGDLFRVPGSVSDTYAYCTARLAYCFKDNRNGCRECKCYSGLFYSEQIRNCTDASVALTTQGDSKIQIIFMSCNSILSVLTLTSKPVVSKNSKL